MVVVLTLDHLAFKLALSFKQSDHTRNFISVVPHSYVLEPIQSLILVVL